jgi:hypothetical protein
LNVTSRNATRDDIDTLLVLYRDLEREQAGLKSMWPVFDGLDTPLADSFASILDDDNSILLVGAIDDVPFGLLWARSEPMLDRAGDERVGVVRLIYTEPEARGVGVAEAISPGHRAAKNFFEANGFAARLILMHHEDPRPPDAAGV